MTQVWTVPAVICIHILCDFITVQQSERILITNSPPEAARSSPVSCGAHIGSSPTEARRIQQGHSHITWNFLYTGRQCGRYSQHAVRAKTYLCHSSDKQTENKINAYVAQQHTCSSRIQNVSKRAFFNWSRSMWWDVTGVLVWHLSADTAHHDLVLCNSLSMCLAPPDFSLNQD